MIANNVLTTMALYAEYGEWLKANNLPEQSAEELLFERGHKMSSKQRAYLQDFIDRWDAAQYAEDAAAPGGLQPHTFHYRGQEIIGVAYAPAASDRDLAQYRHEIEMDRERRQRGLQSRDILAFHPSR